MKKKIIPFLIAVILILVIVAGFLTVRLINRYIPSKEPADLSQYFGVEKDQVALFYDSQRQEAVGFYQEGQVFLPLSWVNDSINQRFYWDSYEKKLVYALPDQIVYADADTVGSTGKKLLWVNEDGVYLSLGLISNYTDIRVSSFTGGEHKRIFIDDRWENVNKADVKKAGKVRLKGGIKSEVLTTALPEDSVTVLETLENWSLIETVDGYVGYLENKRLQNVRVENPVSTFVKPVYQNISLDEKITLVWHQIKSSDSGKEMKELLANTKGINVIAPTWYKLTDNEGNFKSIASKSYVDEAHGMGLQVWALLDNFENTVQTEVLLSRTATRQKLIEGLMKEADNYGFDGINLDFEGIKEEAGIHYVQFIRELSIACRKKGLVLSVDNYVPAPYNEFYNRKEQGTVADYVIIMGYDEHYAGSEPGSVASIGYVEKGIKDTLEMVPKEKLINGVPFYTRLWSETDAGSKSEAIGIQKAKDWIDGKQVEMYWQEELGQNYGSLENEDGAHQIWMEDAKSLALKMDQIKKYDLAGVGCWKLGLESADIWDVITWK